METFQPKVIEKIKTHLLCSIHSLPRKSCHLWDNVEKYGKSRKGRRWQYNTAHALCVLGNQDWDTHRMCNP